MQPDKASAAPVSECPNRDLLLTQLQETGEIPWPPAWPLSWLLDLVDTLGIDRRCVMIFPGKVRLAGGS